MLTRSRKPSPSMSPRRTPPARRSCSFPASESFGHAPVSPGGADALSPAPTEAPSAKTAARPARGRPMATAKLERAAGRGWRSGLERARLTAGPREVLLDQKQIVAGPLHDAQQLRHRGDLLPLLLEEPVQELLTDEIPLVAGERDKSGDLLGHTLLLLEGQLDRFGRAPEVRTRRFDARNRDGQVGL